MPALRRLARALDRHFEEGVCAVLVTLLAGLVFLQVVMRYVFRAPLSWTDEGAIYCMVWFVYIAAALAVRERAHIRVYNVVFALPAPLSTVLFVLSDAAWLAFNLIFMWVAVDLLQTMWARPFSSVVLGIPQKWPYLVLPIGFALMTLRLAQIYWRWLRHGESPAPAAATRRGRPGLE